MLNDWHSAPLRRPTSGQLRRTIFLARLIRPGWLGERLDQHTVKAELAWIAKAVEADSHALLAGGGLGTIGTKQPIPPRQVEPEIAVGLARNHRMMDAMHIRRYDDPAETAVQPFRQPDITMVEHRRRVEHDFKDQDGNGRRAEGGDDGELQAHREQNFNRVKPRARRHVEVEVRMMHAVQTPKHRYGVEQNMLQVDNEIQHQDRDHDSSPAGKRDVVEEAPAALLAQRRNTNSGYGNAETKHQGVEENETQIARPTDPAREGPLPSRSCHFPGRHHNEDTEEDADSYDGFVSENKIRHPVMFLRRVLDDARIHDTQQYS
jgi:hypothetical protein